MAGKGVKRPRGGGSEASGQLGFDMAPVLPRRQETPPLRTSEIPADGTCLPASGSALRAAASPQSSAPVPAGLVPSIELPDSNSQLPIVLSVAELTRRIGGLLEEGIGTIWVEGEISNLRKQSSGHSYFTLKDEASQLPCVLFARAAAAQRVLLHDGLQVQLFGQISVYQPRGQYQLMVRLVQPKGEGVLQARFEQLKRRLADEGLFEPGRKRPMPRFPRRIGVVTSPDGAAIRDFLHVLHRRHPGLRVVINPVRVQGRGAAAEIAAAIGELSAGSPPIDPVDVIVVTRGGGSLEDLWEFNEEAVARAIAASAVPVVSAVGHEIDFSIADFVADLRAPTPSAAAELLAADGAGLLERCRSLVRGIGREAGALLERHQSRGERLADSVLFREPLRRLDEARQRGDRVEEVLGGVLDRRMERFAATVATASAQLAASHPGARIAAARQGISALGDLLGVGTLRRLERERGRFARLQSALAALSPEATLARGFSITRNEEGRVITSAVQVKRGESIRTQLAKGEVGSEVRKVD